MRVTPSLVALGVVLVLAAPLTADFGDERLRIILSETDLIVVGTITSEPQSKAAPNGYVWYSCKFILRRWPAH